MTHTEQSIETHNPKMVLTWLWKGKWTILLSTVLAAGLSAYHIKTNVTPIYRAQTEVITSAQQEQIVDLNNVLGGLASSDRLVLNSEVKVFRSYELLGKVVDTLKLIEDPEYNSRLNPPSKMATLKEALKARVISMIGLETKSVSAPTAESIRNDTILALRSSLLVRNVADTLIFDIVANSEDPAKASLVANTLAELYIDNQLEVKYEATQRATRWLSMRVTELRQELEDADAAVTGFRGSTDLLSPENLLAQERQLKETRDRMERLKETLAGTEQKLAALGEAETFEEKANIADQPGLRNLLKNIDDPLIQSQFDLQYQRQINRLSSERDLSVRQLASLEIAYTEAEAKIKRLNQDLVELEQLVRDAEATRLLYEHFLTRLKETSAQEGIQQADSRVLSAAMVPKVPSSPDTFLAVSMWGILGAIFGILFVVAQRLLKNKVISARDLETLTGYSVLGQVPEVMTRHRRGFLKYLSENPRSEFAEAIRNLRTSLQLSNIDSEPRVISVTSALPGDGKTSISLALAHSYAMSGKRCLLIDGDLRRRTLTKLVSTPKTNNEFGMMAALLGSATLDQAIMPATGDIGCDVLLPENGDSNFLDVFSSQAFTKLLYDARHSYDYVIIDTPPVLIVPDARLVMELVDAAAFVVGWNKTINQQVQDALRIFENSGQKVSGLVLNRINHRALERLGYGEDSYQRYGREYYRMG